MKILTFDIEDWFHILDNPETASPENWANMQSRLEEGVNRVLGLLYDTNQPGTFFCLGWVAEKYPHVIKSIDDNGHHIATHSYNHQLAYNQNKKEFENDLYRSIDIIEQIIGKKIDTYRAPGFSITSENLWAFEILNKLGIKNDCSIFPASRAHGGIPDYGTALPSILRYKESRFKSLPINTTNILGKKIVYSGGGYFRLLPAWYLKKKFASDPYIMTYFHPRDFDPNQPMVPGLNGIRKFKSYVGLNTAYQKLELILNQNKFVNVETAIREIEWTKVKEVTLG
ncbi:MAG: polysaccharide deacetylase family protein [Gammaproteobacteria bacterium]